MIKDGVALVRLSGSPTGTFGRVEEFYVVMFDGVMRPMRYGSYAEAFKQCELLYAETHADVA